MTLMPALDITRYECLKVSIAGLNNYFSLGLITLELISRLLHLLMESELIFDRDGETKFLKFNLTPSFSKVFFVVPACH